MKDIFSQNYLPFADLGPKILLLQIQGFWLKFSEASNNSEG